MKIGVLRETPAGETRSALMPESVRALVALGPSVQIESGVGDQSGAFDADYVAAGAEIIDDKTALLSSVDVLLCVNKPAGEDISRLRSGSVVIGFLRPLDEPDAMV